MTIGEASMPAGTAVATEFGELVMGRFYWVRPADIDSGIWEAETQPARYAGKDEFGNDLWNALGISGDSNWPMRWVGEAIEYKGK